MGSDIVRITIITSVILWALSGSPRLDSVARGQDDEQNAPASADQLSPDTKLSAGLRNASWHLVIGQRRTLHLPQDSQLRVSRRGVIDPIQTGDFEWTLVALQKGVVSVVVTDGASRPVQSILIEVAPPEGGGVNTPANRWPPHPICGTHPGIRCDRRTGQITGKLDRWQDYLDLQKTCAQHGNCSAKVSLSEPAQAEWRRSIHSLLEPFGRYEIRTDGLLILSKDCDPEHHQNKEFLALDIARRIYPAEDIAIRCYGDGPKKLYLLKAKFYLADESAMTESGLDSPLNKTHFGELQKVRNSGDAVEWFRSHLKDLQASKSASLIAQPSMLINTNSPTVVLSGGEVQAATQLGNHGQTSATQLFKKVGLELRVVATAIDDTNLRLNYQVSLSNHTNPGSQSINLASTAFSGELDLPLGQPTVIGGTRFNSEGASSTGSLLMAKIPILGPIFQWSSQDTVHRLAFLWLQVCPAPQRIDGEVVLQPLPVSERWSARVKEDCASTRGQSSPH